MFKLLLNMYDLLYIMLLCLKHCHFSNGNLDAYLGDYPILDYARAKLDPDCKLRLLTQTFGEDGYGIGLPKGSPLKVSFR